MSDFESDDFEFDEVPSNFSERSNTSMSADSHAGDPKDNIKWIRSRVSTDDVMELLSQDSDIYEALKGVPLEGESKLFSPEHTTGEGIDILFNELNKSQVDGDLKTDLYFPYSDLPNKPDRHHECKASRSQVLDFLEKSSDIESEFTSIDRDRYDTLINLLVNSDPDTNKSRLTVARGINDKNCKSVKFSNIPKIKSRSTEKIQGSLNLGDNYEFFRRVSEIWMRDSHSNNIEEYLTDPNIPDQESSDKFLLSNNSILKDFFLKIKNKMILSMLKYYRTLTSQLIHVASMKTKSNDYQILTGGSYNSLTILAHTSPIRDERSEIKFFNAYIVSKEYSEAIKDMRGCFGKFKYYPVGSERVLMISNWYTMTAKTISLYSECHSKTLNCALYISLNCPKSEMYDRIMSSMPMFMMCSVSKVKEVVNFLSLLRYTSVGLLSKYNCIGDLLLDKVDRRVSSMFCSTVIEIYCSEIKRKKPDLRWNSISRESHMMNEEDYIFNAYLPLLGFNTSNIQDYLCEVYLVNLCSDDITHSRHTFPKFIEVLSEYEDKWKRGDDTFHSNPALIELFSEKLINILELYYDLDLSRSDIQNSKLINHASSNGVLSDKGNKCTKLYDRILSETCKTNLEPSLKDIAGQIFIQPFEFTMVEKLQKQNSREIFKTDLTGICCLKLIESFAGTVNKALYSESISLGGDDKYFRVQKETHKILQEYRDPNSCFNSINSRIFSRTSDSSKWSTGDNPSTLISTFSGIKSSLEKFDIRTSEICQTALKKITGRRLILENKRFGSHRLDKKLRSQSEYLRKSVQDKTGKDDDMILYAGWPQGFFNKLSSLKHYICGAIAIALFKINHSDKDVLSDCKIDQCFHSDDYTYIARFNNDIEFKLWEKCLSTARRICCIKENIKKSCCDENVREFLSFFIIMGSVFIPHIKFIINMHKDIPGTSYTEDIYASMSRIRECYRIGVSEVWCQFAMNQSNDRIQRLYSMKPGMCNYDQSINNYTKPCEFGGYFHSHPLLLLFFGIKSNNLRIYNKLGCKDLAKIVPGNYILDEDEDTYGKDYKEIEGFFQFPRFDIKYGSDVKAIIDKLGIVKSKDRSEYYEKMIVKYLPYEKNMEIMRSRLFERSGKRMYAKIPKGLMEAVVHRTSNGIVYNHMEDQYTIKSLYKRIDETVPSIDNVTESMIEMSLFCNSSVLYSVNMLMSGNMTIDSDVEQKNRNVSYLANINLKNPGLEEIKHIPESLCLLSDFVDDDIKDNIKLNLEHWEKSMLNLRQLLKDNFSISTIRNERELELMMKYFTSRYPSNKFLMVPDRKIRKGIDNINIFLKDLLQYRASSYIYRDIDWDPIKSVSGWKGKVVHGTSLVDSVRDSMSDDVITELYNIYLRLDCMSKSKHLRIDVDEVWDDFILNSTYNGIRLIKCIDDAITKVSTKESSERKSQKLLYIMGKCKVLKVDEIIRKMEEYDITVKYYLDPEGNVVLSRGFSSLVVNRKKKKLHLLLGESEINNSVLKLIFIGQQMITSHYGDCAIPAHAFNIWNRKCLLVHEKIIEDGMEMFVGESGMRLKGMKGDKEICIQWLSVERSKHSNTKSATPITYRKLVKRFGGYMDAIEITNTDAGNLVTTMIAKEKIGFLDLFKDEIIRFNAEMVSAKLDGVDFRDLYMSGYFTHYQTLNIGNKFDMSDPTFRNSSQKHLSKIVKSRLTKKELNSLREMFTERAGSLGLIDVESACVDDCDGSSRGSDFTIENIDVIDEKNEGTLGSFKKRIVWFEFEKTCCPKVKLKMLNNQCPTTYIKGLNKLIYEVEEKLVEGYSSSLSDKCGTNTETFWMMCFMMVHISKYKNPYKDKGYIDVDNDTICEQLMEKGGLGRKPKFWNDVLSAIDLNNQSEYY
jgi:hypothetical protein